MKLVLVLAALVSAASAQDSYLARNKLADCGGYVDLSASLDRDANYTRVKPSIAEWQAVVLFAAFAVFTVLISVLHKLLRRYVFYDSHLLDTYFDAGADVNAGLVACFVAMKYAGTGTFTWAGSLSREYGMAAHLIYAAAGAVPLFLFAIVMVEIRIKSPGAKTFLQVIRARFGAAPHIVLIVVALTTNLLLAAMVTAQGSNLLSHLTDDIGEEVICIIFAIVIGIFTTVGGVGGGIYVAYFSCALLLTIVLYYFTDVYYDPLERGGGDQLFGSAASIYNVTKCAKAHDENKDDSIVTFMSRQGFMDGLAIFLCAFSSVFVNQSFWQAGVSSKPGHGVWGFLSAGLVWFALPFVLTYALGLAYWALTLQAGGHLITESHAREGLLPVLTSQLLLGKTGDYVMFTLVMVAVVTTVAGEVLSISSIVLYDVYQTYIAPFDNTITTEVDGTQTLREKRQVRNEEYLVYNRRCALLRYAVVICTSVLVIPISLAVMAIGIDLPWLFKLLGILAGASVLPVSMAITWHRITGPGVMAGVLVGTPAALVSWLVYASQLDGGLGNFRQNTDDSMAVICGSAVALLVGGLVCIVVSLCTGGCRGDLMEEEVWEKTRLVDNPVLPWTVRYAPDIGAHQMVKGKPHFYTVRRAFKSAEVTAYVMGVLLSVVIALVWPACMLLLDILSEGSFKAWTVVVLLVGVLATAYATVLPLAWEAVQTCRQIYYNRQWANFGKHERLHEAPSELSGAKNGGLAKSPAPKQRPPETQTFSNIDDMDSSSNQPLDKDTSSTGSGEKERWKTIIDMDDHY